MRKTGKSKFKKRKVRPLRLNGGAPIEPQVLVIMPVGNEARHTADFLKEAGLSVQVCRNVIAGCRAIRKGCGAVLLSEELLGDGSISVQAKSLAQQPLWSDIPLTIIADQAQLARVQSRRLAVFGPKANVNLLVRPFHPATLTSAMAAAARARDSAQGMRESELRYRQLVSSLPAAVYTTDAGGRVILYNEAATLLWGRRPEVGRDLWCGSHRIFNSDGTPLPLHECPMAVTLREGRPVRGREIIIERPDGSRRNVLPYPDPIRDAAGNIVGAVDMLLDITDGKRAEAAARHLAAIVESSEDAIVSKDLNGVIVTWNDGAQRLFGYKAEEIIGRPVTVLMPPDRWNEEPHILNRIRHGERVEHYETVRRRKDGTLMEISLTVSPIKDAGGTVVGASKIIRNITAQKQAVRDLVRAHEEILVASNAKDEFLAALSHELRTPLNPVLLLASELAEDPELSIEVRQHFALIRNNVALEARLIDDLLDLTRITRGKFSLKLGTVNVHSVIKEAIATVQSELDQKNLAITLDLRAEHPIVKGDAARLQQVFWNVLKNAAKFTPAGGKIRVQTRCPSGSGEITIKITDTGMGMSEAELARIFEAFIQGEHAQAGRTKQFGGLGLGLAISRKLVESHGGKIHAESKGRNQGATLIISLPLMRGPKRKPSPKAGLISAGSR